MSNETTTGKKFYTVKEAAEYLGYSTSTIYKKVLYKEIPHYKPNPKKIYFHIKDLNEYVERNRIASFSETGDAV